MIGLSESIKELGLLTLPVVEPLPDGKYSLIAGERRYRAMILLGWTQVPALLKTEYTPRLSKLAELEENIKRKELDWPEQCELIRQIDELKRQEFGDGGKGQFRSDAWNVDKTAALVDMPAGTVRRELKIARMLFEDPELKKQVAHLPLTVAIRKIEQIKQTEHIEGKISAGTFTTSAEILMGDSLQLIKSIVSETVDLVLTDPPFGLDEIEQTLGTTRGASMTYTALLGSTDNQTMTQAVELLKNLCPELFRVLKPSSHLYMFCSFELYPYLMDTLKTSGFEVDWNPLIWDKQRATTRFSGLSYPSSYEPIIFAHKPPRTKHISNPKVRNILSYPGLHSSRKVHPFQKPPDLIAHLIENSTNRGDMVLDPFAGSGVTIRMAKELNRSAVGFELDRGNWARSQAYLAMGSEYLKNDTAKLAESGK